MKILLTKRDRPQQPLLQLLLALLLLLRRDAWAAPAVAQHLSITLEGDTPALVVTSADIGSAPVTPQTTMLPIATTTKATTSKATVATVKMTTSKSSDTLMAATKMAEFMTFGTEPVTKRHQQQQQQHKLGVANKAKHLKTAKAQFTKKPQAQYVAASKQKTLRQVAVTPKTTAATTTSLPTPLSAGAVAQANYGLGATAATNIAGADIATEAAAAVASERNIPQQTGETLGVMPGAHQTPTITTATTTQKMLVTNMAAKTLLPTPTTTTINVVSEILSQMAASNYEGATTGSHNNDTTTTTMGDDNHALPTAKLNAMQLATVATFSARTTEASATAAETTPTVAKPDVTVAITEQRHVDDKITSTSAASPSASLIAASLVATEQATKMLPATAMEGAAAQMHVRNRYATTTTTDTATANDNVITTTLPETTARAAATTTASEPLATETTKATKANVVKPLQATTKSPATTTATAKTTAEAATTLPTAQYLGVLIDMRHQQQQQPQQLQLEKQPQQHDGLDVAAIKLIDLENHDYPAAVGVHQQQHEQGQGTEQMSASAAHVAGHDGVKQTKKKQLTDKHYLLNLNNEHVANSAPSSNDGASSDTAASGHKVVTYLGATDAANSHDMFSSTTTTAATTTPRHDNLSTNKPVFASSPHTPTSRIMPTLVPVHNGYLGPIFMEERTFSVVHAAPLQKHPLPQQHVASIESQLRDGRLVEIIAPTSLLEQTDATTKGTTTTSRATAAPTVHCAEHIQSTPLLSTTVFQVPETLTSTTRLPSHTKNQPTSNSTGSKKLLSKFAETESKISDIQVEVYDSTVDSIVASTNFKDNEGFYAPQIEAASDTTRAPVGVAAQERFTQYVVDRTDSSTQESSLAAPALSTAFMSGKPEPAAIEIHINVSEGVGNESEDLEFSYQQADYARHVKPGLGSGNYNNFALKTSSKPLAVKTFTSSKNETSEPNDEILVVEIIDTGTADNNTENSASAENINPIFTFRSEAEVSDVELKDVRFVPPEGAVHRPHSSDDLFMADVRRTYNNNNNYLQKPPLPPPPPPRKPSVDRDSDTIFYISNTEVKVGESLPTANTNTNFLQQQQKEQQLESQFFPANYVPHNPKTVAPPPPPHRYEEDIILSPLRNTADALKIFRNPGDNAPPLDVTYVGESIIEVEQSSDANTASPTFSPAYLTPSQTPDVIIQPAILPEMAIGVPVIGELPPQIELKEIDFMPDDVADQPRSNAYDNDIEENSIAGAGNNDVDRLVESSIQYGGDLIDEDARVGFDGVEGSYPFGNPTLLKRRKDGRAGASVLSHNHAAAASHLSRDELSADEGGSVLMASADMENPETRKLLTDAPTNESSFDLKEWFETRTRMGNATAFSVAEEPREKEDITIPVILLASLLVTSLIVTAAVAIGSTFCFFYRKFRSNSSDSNEIADSERGNGDVGGDKSESSLPTPKTSSSPTRKLIPNDSESTLKPSNNSTQSLIDEKSKASSNETTKTEPSSNDALNSVQAQSKCFPNSKQSNPPAGPNGSVTKMTLKNNHLIVETEERNDISRDARETKMHYNTADKDGVFVVEVARGVDSKAIPDSPTAETKLDDFAAKAKAAPASNAATLQVENEKSLQQLQNNKREEEVQIHQPPPEAIPSVANAEQMPRSDLHQIEEVEEPSSTLSPHSNHADAADLEPSRLPQQSQTGLSQSDLSSTSSSDSNKRYSYGNQELYIVEQQGYATTSPSACVPLATADAANEASDDDRKSENSGHSLEHSPTQTNGKPDVETPCKLSQREGNDQPEMPSNADECQLNGHDVDDNQQHDEDEDESQAERQQMNGHVHDNVVETEVQEVSATCQTTEQTDERAAVDSSGNGGDVVNGESHETHFKVEQLAEQTTEGEENGYDSIMSLPAPPTTEEMEMNQLGECSTLMDMPNQLDSLPPPPPPPLCSQTDQMPTDSAAQQETSSSNHKVTEHNVDEHKVDALPQQQQQKQQEQQEESCPPPHNNSATQVKEIPPTLTNGDHSACKLLNGHDSDDYVSMPHPPAASPPCAAATTHVTIASNGKVSPATLTPPASPPPSPPVHFGNAVVVNGGLPCAPKPLPVAIAVAVDVNGS